MMFYIVECLGLLFVHVLLMAGILDEDGVALYGVGVAYIS